MSSGSSLNPIDQGYDRTPLHSILAELSVYDEIPNCLLCKQEVEGSSPSSSTKLAINWKSPRRNAGAFLLLDPKLTQ